MGLNRIAVAPAVALAGDIARVSQLADDAVRGALGDTHLVADLAQPDAGILGDADQYPCVIGQKTPARIAFADIAVTSILDLQFIYR